MSTELPVGNSMLARGLRSSKLLDASEFLAIASSDKEASKDADVDLDGPCWTHTCP